MIGPSQPEHEAARLLDLARYRVLDTLPEPGFDRITRLAARLLRVPVAAINLIDGHRQWSKAAVGLTGTELPRPHSFCAWTIQGDAPMVIPDTAADPRFADNPLVTGHPHLHCYAGAPLVTPAGHAIGTLCVSDTVPHAFGPEDLDNLQDLAALVMTELELRVRTRELEHDLSAQARQTHHLEQTLAQAQVLEAVGSLLDLPLTPEEATRSAAALMGEALGADWTGLVTFREGALSVQAAHHRPDLAPEVLAVAHRLPELSGGVTRTLDGANAPLYLEEYARHPQALSQLAAVGLRAAAWVPLGCHGGTTFLLLTLRSKRNPVTAWRGQDRALLEAAGRTVRAALQRRAALEEAEREARQDALTGLLNRRAFDEDLRGRLGREQSCTLALIDLDGLKAVNDTEGHARGDQLLRTFAECLGAQGEGDRRTYRLGGDEFALLLDGGPQDLSSRVEEAVRCAQEVTALPVGASLGTVGAGEARGAAELLALADARMYQEKRLCRALGWRGSASPSGTRR